MADDRCRVRIDDKVVLVRKVHDDRPYNDEFSVWWLGEKAPWGLVFGSNGWSLVKLLWRGLHRAMRDARLVRAVHDCRGVDAGMVEARLVDGWDLMGCWPDLGQADSDELLRLARQHPAGADATWPVMLEFYGPVRAEWHPARLAGHSRGS